MRSTRTNNSQFSDRQHFVLVFRSVVNMLLQIYYIWGVQLPAEISVLIVSCGYNILGGKKELAQLVSPIYPLP